MSALVAEKKKIIAEPPSTWKCPECGGTATVGVVLEVTPWCQSKKHKSKMVDMVQVKGKQQ